MKNEKIYAVIQTNGNGGPRKTISHHLQFEEAHQAAILFFLKNVETSKSNKQDIFQNIQEFMTLRKPNPKESVIRTSLDKLDESHIEINLLAPAMHIYSNWDNHPLLVSVEELYETNN